jgi:hypothetical protein
MSSKTLLDRLKEDFDSRRVQLEVLGITVFVTPLSMGDQMKINAMHPTDSALRFAEMLVQKCRDEKGKAIFGKDDKMTLKNLVAGNRLTPLINAITGPGVEAAAKN